jgi:hypothetical protein
MFTQQAAISALIIPIARLRSDPLTHCFCRAFLVTAACVEWSGTDGRPIGQRAEATDALLPLVGRSENLNRYGC